MTTTDVPKLTKREREVASLVAQGMTSREIGQRLFISERTAEGHVEQIRSKLGFHSRAEIAAWVARSESVLLPAHVPGPSHPQQARRRRWQTSPTLLAAGSALALLAVVILVIDSVLPRLTATAVALPIATFAGTGDPGISDDGSLPAQTEIAGPAGIAIGQNGVVYFTEGPRIRMVSGSFGFVTTIAGNGFGTGKWQDSNSAINSDLGLPANGGVGVNGAGGDFVTTPEFIGLAVDVAGDVVFADPGHDRVREVTVDGKLVTLSGGGAPPAHVFTTATGTHFDIGDNGPASASVLTHPRGCAFDDHGNLYVADTIDNRVRRIDRATGQITTVAGNGKPEFAGDGGPANLAGLNAPESLAIGRDGALYIADTGNQRIRRVKDGVITTVAGNGQEGYAGDGLIGTSAILDVPLGLAFDSHDNLYIADSGNDRIRKLDVSGRLTTVAGTGARGYSGDGGPAAQAEFAQPVAVAVDKSNNLFIVDSLNNRIRVVALDRAG